MGDGGECVTKTSKGNIYEQLMSPGDQLRAVADLLTPIKDKGLFGIRGNHGNRVDRDSGLGWDETLCHRIGVPYLGVSAFIELRLTEPKRSQFGYICSLYAHHGSSGSITPAGKMSGAHKPEMFIDADLLLTAHTHACGEVWPQRMLAHTNPKAKRIEWKRCHSFVCGSAYDSRSGYAEEKMYPPLVPEHLMITARIAHRWNPRTRYIKIDHEKIRGSEEEFASDHELHKWGW
jgi:hypothetical protein